jgi:hypothetical protein
MLVGLLGGTSWLSSDAPRDIPFDNPRTQDVFSKRLNRPTFGL